MSSSGLVANQSSGSFSVSGGSHSGAEAGGGKKSKLGRLSKPVVRGQVEVPGSRPVEAEAFSDLGSLYVAVVSDALDMVGLRNQCPRVDLLPRTGADFLVGRCRTTAWEDLDGPDPRPYELELEAVDSCRPGDIIIAAANGSRASGIWGELLSTAARNAGCGGVVVDGAVRDLQKMSAIEFPCFARFTCPYDSQHRQRVVSYGEPVQIDGVEFRDGDLVFADRDGVVVVPRAWEKEVLRLAHQKLTDENRTREAIKGGMRATQAYATFGVL